MKLTLSDANPRLAYDTSKQPWWKNEDGTWEKLEAAQVIEVPDFIPTVVQE